MSICYAEKKFYDWEDIDDPMLDGCPICGGDCSKEISEEQKKEIDEYFRNMLYNMSFCYAEQVIYNVDDLKESFPTGCPKCGSNCWEKASEEQKKEIDKYFSLT